MGGGGYGTCARRNLLQQRGGRTLHTVDPQATCVFPAVQQDPKILLILHNTVFAEVVTRPLPTTHRSTPIIPTAPIQGALKTPASFPVSGKGDLCVAITGGAGQIAYALVPLIVHGRVFGEGRKVRLRLLDIEPCAGALQGVAMEIMDCYSELVGANVVCISCGVHSSQVFFYARPFA